MPSNATRQRDWGSWSDAISNSQIKGNQRKQLTNAMETAEYAAQTQVCSDIVETGKDVFDFITSFLLGAITATVENATSWHTTWQSVNAEIQGKEFLTLTEILEGSVKNQMAFYIGKLVADVGGMIGGMILAFLGMGGNVGGLTFAPVTGGAFLSVTAASTALALEGVAITVSAAGDISVSAEKIAAEISKFPSSSGSNDDSGDEGDSDSKKNKIPDNDSTTGHIFRDAEGHIPDTPENRALLEDVANDPANFRRTDKYGNEWYTKIQSDGSQVWVESRNGNIFEGGVNNTPKPWNPETGLKKP